ncbi:subtilisin-like protease SBT5.6 [Impatiens glandulifera]|uniref:subtilisin-like protease SBT5.6 n=1 Tax=Impatiens glandulifera TaxID=253017 RepID=UPI001FB096D6|nr:subtilisin-like protease SBT5.6 [Impatiens glandulifera]
MKITISFLLLLLPLFASSLDNHDRQVYIVYLGEHKGNREFHEIENNHRSYLESVNESDEEVESSLVYSYKHSINGFAALLNPQQASKISEMEEVVSVIRSEARKYVTHTTRSWEFSGLKETFSRKNLVKDDILLKSKYGKGIIVGVFDSGVWPESKSFSDGDMGPIPKSWKGICQTGHTFNSSHCNRKIIGARYYIKGYEQFYGKLNTTLDSMSPRDMDGHGTHTASTIAGRTVKGVSALGGFAKGTASGGAPLAHLAIYKVCWAIPNAGKEGGNTCFEEDMLAGIDQAIADGVHIMSLSIGTTKPIPYMKDGIALGALHAMKNNIVVSCSAGNNGPTASTLSNVAPWIITVGASSVDRAFIATVKLGNGMIFEGETVTPYKLKKGMYPVVYAAQVVESLVPKSAIDGQCLPGSLSPEKTKGKIVLCLRGNGTRVGKGQEVKRAGGLGFILGNNPQNGADVAADAHVLPAIAVNSDNAIKILAYINSTINPTAYITIAKTLLNRKPAPSMASFTSRGPNTITPDILKPDITAPGINILAAWSGADAPTKLATDTRIVEYNILSGTSMSCPHISATAALLKAIHPTWSSAAIRSALITSSGLNNNEGNLLTDASGITPADPFQFGAGHFRPTKAADPGLVYDASYEDYLLFLCSSGVNNIDPSTFKCPKQSPSPMNLNYPSIAISKVNRTVTVKRTVTNVGGRKSIYFASVKPPVGFSVKVSPAMLKFSRVGEKKSFTVTIRVREDGSLSMEKGEYGFGWLTWRDEIHIVTSPIALSLA